MQVTKGSLSPTGPFLIDVARYSTHPAVWKKIIGSLKLDVLSLRAHIKLNIFFLLRLDTRFSVDAYLTIHLHKIMTNSCRKQVPSCSSPNKASLSKSYKNQILGQCCIFKTTKQNLPLWSQGHSLVVGACLASPRPWV